MCVIAPGIFNLWQAVRSSPRDVGLCMKSIRRRCMGRGVGAKDNSKSRRYMRPISESQRHEHVLEDVCCRKWNQRAYTNTFANLLIVLSLPSHANRNRGLQHGAHMHTRNKARRSHYYLVCSLRLSLATVSTSANLPGSKDMGTQTRQYPYMYAGCVCVRDCTRHLQSVASCTEQP